MLKGTVSPDLFPLFLYQTVPLDLRAFDKQISLFLLIGYTAE